MSDFSSHKELPRDRIVTLTSDVASLKKELRQAAIRETNEVKSKVKPNSAHKVNKRENHHQPKIISKNSCRLMPGETC